MISKTRCPKHRQSCKIGPQLNDLYRLIIIQRPVHDQSTDELINWLILSPLQELLWANSLMTYFLISEVKIFQGITAYIVMVFSPFLMILFHQN